MKMKKLRLKNPLRGYGLRLRLTPWDPIPFVAITLEKKKKLPKNWFKTTKGWKKELFG